MFRELKQRIGQGLTPNSGRTSGASEQVSYRYSCIRIQWTNVTFLELRPDTPTQNVAVVW